MLMSLPGPFVSSAATGAPKAWRTAHVGPIATLWLLLWIVVSLIEIAPTIHNVRVPVWQPIVAALIPMGVVLGWLLWEISSTQFERPSLHPPHKWFTHHLRRLPLFAVIVTARQRLACARSAASRAFCWAPRPPLRSRQ
jgi:hypothetical protein